MLNPGPHLYFRWLDQRFGTGGLPVESKATCSDCAMCKPESGFSPVSDDDQLRFIRNGCCTYYPELPNFLVGQVLSRAPGHMTHTSGRPAEPDQYDDGAEQALGVVRARIRARARCTPFGIQPTMSADKIQTDPFISVFGREESFRCPYQRTTDFACTIWGQRNSVCSTWFCKFERGNLSSDAWSAVKRLLAEVETVLSSWCVVDLLDSEPMALLFDQSGKPRKDVMRKLSGGLEDDGFVPDVVARRVWGRWYGREEEFFRTCAERVIALDWADVQRLAGTRLAMLERLAEGALAKLTRFDVPARLRHVGLPGSVFQIRRTADDRAAVYSGGFDVQHFDAALLDHLSLFDGHSSLAHVRERLSEQRIDLGDDALRRLLDYGLLEAADAEPRNLDATSPVQPTDRLRVVWPVDVDSAVDVDQAGAVVFKISCGYTDAEFNGPDLLEFGRQLVQHRFGFQAGRCTEWSTAPESLAWERVSSLLDTLLAEGVLERVEVHGMPVMRP